MTKPKYGSRSYLEDKINAPTQLTTTRAQDNRLRQQWIKALLEHNGN